MAFLGLLLTVTVATAARIGLRQGQTPRPSTHAAQILSLGSLHQLRKQLQQDAARLGRQLEGIGNFGRNLYVFRSRRRPKARLGVSRKNGVLPVSGTGRRPAAGLRCSLPAASPSRPWPRNPSYTFLDNIVLSRNKIRAVTDTCKFPARAVLVAFKFCDPV